MSDLQHQNFDTVQSNLQPAPQTIASAATIAPTGFLTLLTGTTNISTITPPVTGVHMLAFISSGATPFVTGGGSDGAIAANVTLAADQLCLMVYNPNTQEYTGGVTAAT